MTVVPFVLLNTVSVVPCPSRARIAPLVEAELRMLTYELLSLSLNNTRSAVSNSFCCPGRNGKPTARATMAKTKANIFLHLNMVFLLSKAHLNRHKRAPMFCGVKKWDKNEQRKTS